jgi:thymidylate synthase ThyX
MLKVTGKGNISVTIIAHSKSAVDGKEIITYELEYHRYIHSELMTHRTFSRNAASSRAIPVSKMIGLVRTSPATPIHWGKNQAGMQATNEVDNCAKLFSNRCWEEAAHEASINASNMADNGVHKQITNRLLEPFQMIKVVVTATEWDNFFWLRFHNAAQPEIQELARCMLVAKKRSVAEVLQVGEWHTPYYRNGYWKSSFDNGVVHSDTDASCVLLEEALKISASCSAQVSYRKTDDSLEKADKVWQMLTTDERLHSSPTEHQATPMSMNFFCFDCQKDGDECWEHGVTHLDKLGKFWSNNFCGWIQHRALIANNNCTSFDYDQEIDETGLVITDNVEV